MIRSTRCRKSPRLESLETREMLSGPTAQQQYMLELMNLARTNPAEAADQFTHDLDANVTATVNYYHVDMDAVRSAIASAPAKPPLAWNDKLASAAQAHSQDQANTKVQSHTGSDGSNLDTRLDRVGYKNRSSSGENAYAYSTSVDEAMQAFLIDWGVASNGHRENLLQPDKSADQSYREVGIGIVETSGFDSNGNAFGPEVITQDFGAQNGAKAVLLGVAFNDGNGDDFYEPGEGRGDVTIDAVNTDTGATSETHSMDAGGYQIALDPGVYKVTAHVGDQIVRTDRVTIGGTNVKVDYNLSDPWQGGTFAPAVTKAAAQTVATSSDDSSTSTPAPAVTAPTPVTVPQAQLNTQPTNTSTLNRAFGSGFHFSWITNWMSFKAK